MIDYPTNISDNITFAEATRSATAVKHGLPNLPDQEQLENMIYVAENVFEPLRKAVAHDKPIIVSSFFRHHKVNSKIKGASKTSDHPHGCALDLKKARNADYTNADIFRYILKHLDFDQLIWEYGTTTEPRWVHVSLRKHGPNRKQVIYNL